jgi:hypothetical protein
VRLGEKDDRSIDSFNDASYSESMRGESSEPVELSPVPHRLYRAGKPNPSNLTPRPGEDGVSYWDRLANPWSLEPGHRPVFRPGEPYHAIDPSQLPTGSVVPTPPEGHWIVGRDVSPDRIKSAVRERDVFPL